MFWFSRPSILASKTHPKLMLFKTPSWTLVVFYVDFIRKLSILKPLQNLAVAKMSPQIDQVAPNCQKVACPFPTLDILFLFAACFFKVFWAPPCAFWIDLGSMLAPFQIGFLNFYTQLGLTNIPITYSNEPLFTLLV